MKYKTINGFTKAKMINVIKNRIKDKPCINNLGMCSYSDNKGNHCAIGAFIPDNNKAMRYQGNVKTMLFHFPILKGHLPLSEIGLNEMQCIHDKCAKLKQNPVPLLIKWIEESVTNES